MPLNVTFIPGNAFLTMGLPVVKLSDDNRGEKLTIGAMESKSTAAPSDGVFRITAVTENVNVTVAPDSGNPATATAGTLILAGRTEYFSCASGEIVSAYEANIT